GAVAAARVAARRYPVSGRSPPRWAGPSPSRRGRCRGKWPGTSARSRSEASGTFASHYRGDRSKLTGGVAVDGTVCQLCPAVIFSKHPSDPLTAAERHFHIQRAARVFLGIGVHVIE